VPVPCFKTRYFKPLGVVIISSEFVDVAVTLGAFVLALLSPGDWIVLLQPSIHRLAAAIIRNRRVIIICCHESQSRQFQRSDAFGQARGTRSKNGNRSRGEAGKKENEEFKPRNTKYAKNRKDEEVSRGDAEARRRRRANRGEGTETVIQKLFIV